MNFLSYFNVFNKKKDSDPVEDGMEDKAEKEHKISVNRLEMQDDTSEGINIPPIHKTHLPISAKGVKMMMEDGPPSPGKMSSMRQSKSAIISRHLKVENLVMEARRPSISDPNEIFNKIIGNSKKMADSVWAAKQKREAIMVPQANPNIDEWDEEMAEIHKYVEHKEDVLYSESYYCTKNGKIKGMLTIKKEIIVFDPLKCEENNQFEDLSIYSWFIDLKDISDVQIIKLPNETAQYIKDDNDRQCYIYDYYLQVALTTVDGGTLNRLLQKSEQKNIKLTKSRSVQSDDIERTTELDVELSIKKSESGSKYNKLRIDDDNIFHQQSVKPAIAMTFFRFSHRGLDQKPLKNKQQEAIVNNIYQNIFYSAEIMEPHKLSSTKVPFYDQLFDEDDKKIAYTSDDINKLGLHVYAENIKSRKVKEDSIVEDKSKYNKNKIYDDVQSETETKSNMKSGNGKVSLNKNPSISISLPSFSPFRSGDKSNIISDTQAIMISRLLPPIIRMREWERLYSVDVDGVSLNTFFANCNSHTATILLIQDTEGWKFGWYAASDWEINRYFYGTGESFLFTFENTDEQMKRYKWSGMNDNIQYSDKKSIAMGGDGGSHALYLRNYFKNGYSHKCGTFGNDVLSSTEDFEVVKFEVWGFDWY